MENISKDNIYVVAFGSPKCGKTTILNKLRIEHTNVVEHKIGKKGSPVLVVKEAGDLTPDEIEKLMAYKVKARTPRPHNIVILQPLVDHDARDLLVKVLKTRTFTNTSVWQEVENAFQIPRDARSQVDFAIIFHSDNEDECRRVYRHYGFFKNAEAKFIEKVKNLKEYECLIINQQTGKVKKEKLFGTQPTPKEMPPPEIEEEWTWWSYLGY